MQDLKKIIEDAIQSHEAQVQLFPRITENDVHMAIRQVMRDNPDIFWFSHQWHYSLSEAIVRFRYTIDKERSAKIQRQIEDVVDNDFKLDYVRTLPVREQVMYVYKWIALYCNYDIHSAHNQTIYSVFVHRHSVCTGIAKAAQYLLELLGIESRLVFGKMNNSEEESRHCWLVVNIEGKWYHLDPTFALPETEHLLRQCGEEPIKGEDLLFYNYFCVDTATIMKTRTIEEEELLPKCNEHLSYSSLQNIEVTPSRNGNQAGLGCILSDVGTTADIYLAHSADKHFRKRTVAKVFRNDSGHELLRKELIVMRECAGTHLLRAMDADFDKGILYMEQAIPLSELLASHYYKLTVKEFCNLLIDIASGLKELLEHGIFYRDIHLNNIFFSDTVIDGRNIYKLGDFGSCTFADEDGRFSGLTERGGVGSKWYMAPETWNDGVFDERSAVYGVCMIGYFLLNDLFPPLWNEFGTECFNKRLSGHELPSIDLRFFNNKKLENSLLFLIGKGLKTVPDYRFQNLSDLIDELEEFWRQLGLSDYTLPKFSVSSNSIEAFSKTQISYRWLDSNTTEITHSKYIELEVACPQCGYVFNVNVLQSLMDRMLDAAQGLHNMPFKTETDGITCPRCGIVTTIGKCYSSHCLSVLPKSNSRGKGFSTSRQRIDDYATTCIPYFSNGESPQKDNRQQKRHPETYFPYSKNVQSYPSMESYECDKSAPQSSKGFLGKLKDLLFGKTNTPVPTMSKDRRPLAEKVNSSVFAPSEIKRGGHLMVQVYLHLLEETEKVMALASEADKNAERRGYEPLEVPLKKGDNVEIELNINGDSLLYNCRKSVVWQGSFVKRAFDFVVPSDIDASELSCSVNVFVNGAIAGELIFITNIVDTPRVLNTNVIAKPTKKLFISYSHKDIKEAEKIAKIQEALGTDVFFDKHRLKAGYIFSEEISRFIQTADTFVLCWSENAANSDYVEKERQEALALAYPQRKPREQAILSILPFNIEPHAVPPADMIEHYHFAEL